MIQSTRRAWKRTGPRHAQIHLPPLTGDEALLLVNLLDRAITAIWRAHADEMADLLACVDPEAAVSTDPSDVVAATAGRLSDEPF